MTDALTKRVEALEKVLSSEEWDPVTLLLYVEDASLDSDGTEELLAIVKSGSPDKPGQSFYRQEGEAEKDFLHRAEYVLKCP